MAIFFIIATLLLLAIAGITVKLWTMRSHAVVSDHNSDHDPNWEVLLAKRNEIERDTLLPAQTKDDLRAEWAQTADTVLSRTVSHPALNAARSHAWAVAAGVMALAIAVYAATGRWDSRAVAWNWQSQPQSNAKFEPPPAEGAAHPGSKETLEERITLLEQKLQQSPDDLGGWVRLSRMRAIQRDFIKSAAALERALALAPGHPDLLADLADILALTADRSLAGRPSALIKQALQADPRHRKALSLAATEAMQQNNSAKAIGYWQRLRATFPEDAPEIGQINAIIANLGTSSGAPRSATKDMPASTKSTDATGATAAIEGRVTLAPALIAAVKKRSWPESAMLFILARRPGGPPMPVAVLRLPVQQLTSGKAVTFRLDDNQTMTPTTKLSTFSEVDIEARISMSGTASRQPDDVSVTLSGVKVGTTGLHLVLPPAP